MADWGFLGGLFEAMQTHSPLLGRLWLQIMLVFRMLILGTVATDLFEDEQEQFECNTAQPGCKQVCYDQAFPISQYRFWVFHIVLISTPALLFLMYAMHLHTKARAHREGETSASGHAGESGLGKAEWEGVAGPQQDRHTMRLYMLNVGFRFLAEVAFLVGQWALYGFHVASQYPCSRFPCPYTVDCFTSRPMEKTIFLCFYFAVGVLSALFSLAELLHVFAKWRRRRKEARQGPPDEEMYMEDQRDAGKARKGRGAEREGLRGGSGDGKRKQIYQGGRRGRSGGSSDSTSSSSRGKMRLSLGRNNRSNFSATHTSSRYGGQKTRTFMV